MTTMIAHDPRAVASLKSFFEPRVVAVIGASREPHRIGSELMLNLVTRFTGTVVPVNPAAEEICGRKAYKRIVDVPLEIDLAVVIVPAAQVEAVVDDCLAKHVPAICIISAGFGECGEEGRALEQAIVAKARAAGTRIVGPNCMGLLHTDPRM